MLRVAERVPYFMGEVAAMASRRERVQMKHDLAIMETMSKGLEDEVMRVQADGEEKPPPGV